MNDDSDFGAITLDCRHQIYVFISTKEIFYVFISMEETFYVSI